MKTILFQNGAVGDFLMAVYVAEQLHAAGKAESILIAVPRNRAFLEGFLGSYPFISVREVSRSHPLSALQLLPYLLQRTVAVLQPTPGRVPAQVKWAAWALTRMPGSRLVGFADGSTLCKSLYATCLAYDTDISFLKTMHQLLRAVGVSGPLPPPRLAIAFDPHARDTAGLAEKPYVFFHPRGSSEKRSFSSEAATKLIDALHAQHPELFVAVSGSNSERAWIESVVAQAQHPSRVRIVCGAPATTLSALIAQAAYFIGVDTGITHLACFLGVRALVVAHKGTANWLPFYHPGARVLYRLEEEDVVRDDEAYLTAHRHGRLKPFGNVPIEAVTEALRSVDLL